MVRAISSVRSFVVVALCACLGCASASRSAASLARASLPSDVPPDVSEASPSPRCGSAYRRLCGPGSQASDSRAAREKELASEIERATLDALGPSLGLDRPSRDRWRAHLAAQPADARESLMVRYRRARATEVARRTAPLEPTVRAEHERLRSVALDRLRASGHVDPRARQRLEGSVLSWIELAPDAEVPRAIRRGCGDDLLKDDAWVTKDARSITLCPGFLLVSARSSAPEAELRQAIAFLLAHELGHVIVGPTSSLEEARDAERLADGWAARILGADLAALPDRAAREDYLRRSVEPICSPGSDATHASGAERVELVVARDPHIAAVLVCDLELAD